MDFEPEIEEALKERFDEALDPVYDALRVSQGGQQPGQLRRHVFDFFDGIRLIISREKVPDGNVVLHVSASCQNNGAPNSKEFVVMIIGKVNFLRGQAVPGLVKAFASDGGVMHLVFPEMPAWLKGAVISPNPQWN